MQTPDRGTPERARARSVTAQARQADQSGSLVAPLTEGKPRVAMVKVWSRKAETSASEYWICDVEVLVTATEPSMGAALPIRT